MDHLIRVGNPRFFQCTGPHSLTVVAEAAGCEPPTGDALLLGLASLALATSNQVTFVAGPRHTAALAQTRAGVVLVSAEMLSAVPPGTVPLVTSDPMAAWGKIAALFHPMPSVRPGIHPSAVIMEGSYVDGSAEICAQAVIESGVEIGPQCKIGVGSIIGNGVILGPDCRIGSHASITYSTLGARVYVYAGARIGQEGFGFTFMLDGFRSVPQLGSVIIGDDVEVGANTTIDRGALSDTIIGAGTRLDNQVQIGHGVQIGRHCAIAALAGISGSAEIGDFVMVGGQAGFAEHVHVGTRSRVSAQSGVMSDLDPGVVVFGSPARPTREAFREIATLKRLARARRS